MISAKHRRNQKPKDYQNPPPGYKHILLSYKSVKSIINILWQE